jgi:hypothetical protein
MECIETSNGQLVQVLIEDDGPGIGAEHKDRTFELFFTTKKDVGTGLGLWVTKEIIARHGGKHRGALPGRQGLFWLRIQCPSAQRRRISEWFAKGLRGEASFSRCRHRSSARTACWLDMVLPFILESCRRPAEARR